VKSRELWNRDVSSSIERVCELTAAELADNDLRDMSGMEVEGQNDGSGRAVNQKPP